MSWLLGSSSSSLQDQAVSVQGLDAAAHETEADRHLVKQWIRFLECEDGRLEYRVEDPNLAAVVPFLSFRGVFLFSQALEICFLNPTVSDDSINRLAALCCIREDDFLQQQHAGAVPGGEDHESKRPTDYSRIRLLLLQKLLPALEHLATEDANSLLRQQISPGATAGPGGDEGRSTLLQGGTTNPTVVLERVKQLAKTRDEITTGDEPRSSGPPEDEAKQTIAHAGGDGNKAGAAAVGGNDEVDNGPPSTSCGPPDEQDPHQIKSECSTPPDDAVDLFLSTRVALQQVRDLALRALFKQDPIVDALRFYRRSLEYQAADESPTTLERHGEFQEAYQSRKDLCRFLAKVRTCLLQEAEQLQCCIQPLVGDKDHHHSEVEGINKNMAKSKRKNKSALAAFTAVDASICRKQSRSLMTKLQNLHTALRESAEAQGRLGEQVQELQQEEEHEFRTSMREKLLETEAEVEALEARLQGLQQDVEAVSGQLAEKRRRREHLTIQAPTRRRESYEATVASLMAEQEREADLVRKLGICVAPETAKFQLSKLTEVEIRERLQAVSASFLLHETPSKGSFSGEQSEAAPQGGQDENVGTSAEEGAPRDKNDESKQDQDTSRQSRILEPSWSFPRLRAGLREHLYLLMPSVPPATCPAQQRGAVAPSAPSSNSEQKEDHGAALVSAVPTSTSSTVCSPLLFEQHQQEPGSSEEAESDREPFAIILRTHTSQREARRSCTTSAQHHLHFEPSSISSQGNKAIKSSRAAPLSSPRTGVLDAFLTAPSLQSEVERRATTQLLTTLQFGMDRLEAAARWFERCSSQEEDQNLQEKASGIFQDAWEASEKCFLELSPTIATTLDEKDKDGSSTSENKHDHDEEVASLLEKWKSCKSRRSAVWKRMKVHKNNDKSLGSDA
ncbi:unnamed protein product, partial [Amoebophrya sp. A120]|eukprot:GSA120T00001453001.1